MTKTLLLKLLATKKLQISDGRISLQDTDFNLLPAIFISSLTEYYKRQDELHKLYLISWFWGFDLVGAVTKDLGLDTPDAVYSVGMNLAENMGMGLYKSHDYRPGQYTRFRIETNPYLRHISDEILDGPIDYFVAGAMGGGGCHVHEAACQSVELRCKAEGSGACEFLTGTKEELKDRDIWTAAEKRYKLGKIQDFQNDVFNNYNRDDSEQFVKRLSELLEKI